MAFLKFLNPFTIYRRLLSVWRLPSVVEAGFTVRDEMAQSVAAHVLRRQYPALHQGGGSPNPLAAHEVKVCSMNGEDGILLHLFSRIGTTDGRFVEFGIGDGRECNTANLSLHFGWSGLLMDINEQDVARARAFYDDRLGGERDRVRIARHAVTAESINDLLGRYGMTGTLDLLSIDIDGNDWWVWRAITVATPRVVVVEYNPSFGMNRSVTIPYQPAFSRFVGHPSGFYYGASLAALTALGKAKGYALVGCDSSGSNAFFVRADLLPSTDLVERSADAAFMPSRTRLRTTSSEDQWKTVRHLPLVEV